MKLKGSDYIVEHLIENGVKDIFGYPGGMVTHLMDSLSKYSDKIATHINYHEQASSFAACGYSQITETPSVVFATSGPGATNLITGIANAYFDSIPVIFITGQVNTTEKKDGLLVRQRGFQETDIVSIAKPVTKTSIYVSSIEILPESLDLAFEIAMSGRKGPVLLDIPMNIQREIIEFDKIKTKASNYKEVSDSAIKLDELITCIKNSKRPCFVIGAGASSKQSKKEIKALSKIINIPIITTLMAVDLLETSDNLNFGFLGAYGARSANFILAKADLVVTIGARLDIRQVGARRSEFAPQAKLVRIDIDAGEFTYKVKEDEIQIAASSEFALEYLTNNLKDYKCNDDWLNTCKTLKTKLEIDEISSAEQYIRKISSFIKDDVVITTDVGQNQIWVAQYYNIKNNDKMLFSGGHGAMGYSLPAAVGAHYATGSRVICFAGDGGFQMNIQELAYIATEQLPITIIVLNNNALGMIRHFQEVFFDKNYAYTVNDNGYSSPNFTNIAKGYGIESYSVNNIEEINSDWFNLNKPIVIELCFEEETYIFPRLKFGNPTHDQEPFMPRELINELMDL